MAELWVGNGEPFARLSEAIATAKSGDTIYVRAGRYVDDFSVISQDVRIVGVGGKAHFQALNMPTNGKGIFVVRADVTIENLEFSGARVRDENGAGIRHSSGTLTIKNSYFHDNQQGILTTNDASLHLKIVGSEFARNGHDGYTHGVYAGRIGSLEVVDSSFHGTEPGHLLKSRAASTTISNSRFFDDQDGTASRQIDLPNGGEVFIDNSVLIKGPDATQGNMIGFGMAGKLHPNSVLQIEGTSFVSTRTGGATRMIDRVADTEIRLGSDNVYEGIDFLVNKGSYEVYTPTDGSLPAPPPVEPESVSFDGVDLTGTNRGEKLFGTDASDIIKGLGGNDRIISGRGADLLTGGAGFDVFRGKVADHDGDTITDFDGDRITVFKVTLDTSDLRTSIDADGMTLQFAGATMRLEGLTQGGFVAKAQNGYTILTHDLNAGAGLSLSEPAAKSTASSAVANETSIKSADIFASADQPLAMDELIAIKGGDDLFMAAENEILAADPSLPLGLAYGELANLVEQMTSIEPILV